MGKRSFIVTQSIKKLPAEERTWALDKSGFRILSDDKKVRRNPNDPAKFVGKTAAATDGNVAKIHYYLDMEKIADEEKYDGLYAVCTDLLNDHPRDIIKVRWQIGSRHTFLRAQNRCGACKYGLYGGFVAQQSLLFILKIDLRCYSGGLCF